MHNVSPTRRGRADITSGTRWREGCARIAAAMAMVPMSGCTLELLDPKGSVGEQEKHLILIALGVMLLVVIPVIVLTLVFFWRYRETNTAATYSPKWAHSTKIEVVVWSIPVVIVVSLAVMIWETTHKLDPYRPIEPVATDKPPVRVEVVALNWKWLFIYPDYHVATVNKLVLPVDTPVEFKLTAESLMNAFFIPQLGSMVYAMSGMQTKLHLIASETGTYAGMSSAYSGAGFSDMHFKTHVTSRDDFDEWVRQAQGVPDTLDAPTYVKLEQPGTGAPVAIYANVMPGLFDAIVGKYMGPMDGASQDMRVTGNAIDDIIAAANCRVDGQLDSSDRRALLAQRPERDAGTQPGAQRALTE
ncbi:ubiquinol oxidase subunit II [Pandoraea fibrosis]|uniref:Ubiquinol oxidase polypeptide II n=2 Tax=Pandoraea fibrosis TaxID=1891094 RepID=A0ABX6HY64_9BURK|nr:ubiquinol oxidase subunit II [Pandoraea fibrosis]QHF15905.1 ubiquinol oxidase subunit II [Pandoraea fibrosis]